MKNALLLNLTAWLLLLPACSSEKPAANSKDFKVLVLGMDGLDPAILERLMSEEQLPNFSRLKALGGYSVFGTSMPPQSPVAWSNFISGAKPGTHQIFDFIHRHANPQRPDLPIEPFLSTSEALPPENPDKALNLGQWRIPLEFGKVLNLRHGEAFWDYLLSHGVDVTIYRMPANYPPPTADEVKGPGKLHVLSGMGTPDLLGSYGDFLFFTEDMEQDERKVAGGAFIRLNVLNDRTKAVLKGPPNYLLKPPLDQQPDAAQTPEAMTVELEIVRDPIEKTITVATGDERLLLKEGEWSNWIPIEFKTGLPGATVVDSLGLPTSVRSIIRLYVKQVHPYLNIYCSPMQIDPTKPANPISYPPEWAAEIAATTGMGGMYTTGIPEDTKAVRSRPQALNEDEFLRMVGLLTEERTRQYHDALRKFDRGFLYFYFGHTDQLAHIFWRDMDPLHPGRLPEQEGRYAEVVYDTYREMDVRLGEAFEALKADDALIVMSDHGFSSFRRGFNVNNWLVDNGYMSVYDTGREGRSWKWANIRFEQTRVYALGLNCVYVNLLGREKKGIVPESEYRRLVEEVAGKLEQVRDDDGSKVIDKVYIVRDLYPNADPSVAPDLLIGYTANYRASWATAEGGIGRGLIEDNKDRWSGDHCIEYQVVPGVLLSNCKITAADPELSDLGPAIIQLFGIRPPEEMVQRNIFGEKTSLKR